LHNYEREIKTTERCLLYKTYNKLDVLRIISWLNHYISTLVDMKMTFDYKITLNNFIGDD